MKRRLLGMVVGFDMFSFSDYSWVCVVAAEFPKLPIQSLEVGFWWSWSKFPVDSGGQVLCLVWWRLFKSEKTVKARISVVAPVWYSGSGESSVSFPMLILEVVKAVEAFVMCGSS